MTEWVTVGVDLGALANEIPACCGCFLFYRLLQTAFVTVDVITDIVEYMEFSPANGSTTSEFHDHLMMAWMILVIASAVIFVLEIGIAVYTIDKLFKGKRWTKKSLRYFAIAEGLLLFLIMAVEDIGTTTVTVLLYYDKQILESDLQTLVSQISTVTTMTACIYQALRSCYKAVVFLKQHGGSGCCLIIFCCDGCVGKYCQKYFHLWSHIIFTTLAVNTVMIATTKIIFSFDGVFDEIVELYALISVFNGCVAIFWVFVAQYIY